MATIIVGAIIGSMGGLGAVTAAHGLAAGALAVGAMFGAGVLDQAVTYPALFGSPKGNTPRLENLSMTADEGAPINYCIGPENRVPGTVIWMGSLVEVES